jgi:hypothetical protein
MRPADDLRSPRFDLHARHALEVAQSVHADTKAGAPHPRGSAPGRAPMTTLWVPSPHARQLMENGNGGRSYFHGTPGG